MAKVLIRLNPNTINARLCFSLITITNLKQLKPRNKLNNTFLRLKLKQAKTEIIKIHLIQIFNRINEWFVFGINTI